MKKEKFIEKSIKIHGNKYDYTSVNYINIHTKVLIYCKKCKKYFEQRPDHHYGGCGCQQCSNNKKLNTQTFIEKSKKLYGDKFDYSLVDYKNMHTKVKLICKHHGEFEQTPMTHLKNGSQCCAKNNKLDTKKFIDIANKIHNNKYDYSLVDYKNNHTKIKIICKYHNYIFEQLPNNHSSKKHNCPLCGNKKRRLNRINQIIINKLNGVQLIPSFNSNACVIFDNICKLKNVQIQHAMNGGEYYIAKLGYWLDGYDIVNNVVYEYDEKHHFDKNGDLSNADKIRQYEIEKFLNCKFIRFKYDMTMTDILNLV